MIGVGVIAGIAGPFSTFEHLAPAPRIAYWLAIALCSYGAGAVGTVIATRFLLPKDAAPLLRIVICGLGASVPVTAMVVLISWLFFLDLEQTGLGLGELFVYCLVISLALLAVLEGVIVPYWHRQAEDANAGPAAARPAPILERLPQDIRAPLSHMSMADHYVEVHTERGMALVLLRMSDAIAETGDIEGMRVHRSHWVAREAVVGLRRVDNRPMIETRSGALLPVSRSYLDSVRASLAKT